MAIPQLRRFTSPNGIQGFSNTPETVNPNANIPKLGGGMNPQQRFAQQQAQMAGNPQLNAELNAAAQNKAENLAMFGGGFPQLAGRSQEMQLAIDKANGMIRNGSGFDVKYGQKQLDTLLGNEAAQQQNAINQQGNMLDLQKSRESNQFDQNKNFVDLITRQSELDQNKAFELEKLGIASKLDKQAQEDKFGMDLKLKQMELDQKANAPVSPMEQARIDDLKLRQEERDRKVKEERDTKQIGTNDAMGNARSLVNDIDRIMELQGRTMTGGISGSEPAGWLRKQVGNEDYAQLEKDYADLLIKGLGVYKSMGSSLGLNPTDKDVKLLERTKPSVTSSAEVNKRALATMKLPVMEEYNRKYAAAKSKGLSTEGMAAPFSPEEIAAVKATIAPSAKTLSAGGTDKKAMPQGWTVSVE